MTVRTARGRPSTAESTCGESKRRDANPDNGNPRAFAEILISAGTEDRRNNFAATTIEVKATAPAIRANGPLGEFVLIRTNATTVIGRTAPADAK
jgi:hypothetical protein